MDQELYTKLLNAATILTKLDEVNNALKSIKGKIKSLENEPGNIIKRANIERTEGRHDGTKRTGIIFICIAIGLFFMILVSASGGYDSAGAAFILLALPFLIAGIGMIALAVTLDNTLEQSYEKQIQNAKALEVSNAPIIAALQKKYEEYRVVLEEIEKAKEGYLDVLPKVYQTTYVVSFLIVAIENKRADTLKEAINLYEEECRHQALLSTLDSMQDQSAYISRALEVVANNQAHIDSSVKKLLSLETVEFLTN